MTVNYMLDQASEMQVAEHLFQCDEGFVQSLNDRVSISDYSRKIAKKATRFEAWADGELVGLVATYANNAESGVAYITSVSVLPEWQGRGVASKLMWNCIEYVKESCFDRIELEVGRDNQGATGLYEKHGFVVDKAKGCFATMILNFNKDNYEQ